MKSYLDKHRAVSQCHGDSSLLWRGMDTCQSDSVHLALLIPKFEQRWVLVYEGSYSTSIVRAISDHRYRRHDVLEPV